VRGTTTIKVGILILSTMSIENCATGTFKVADWRRILTHVYDAGYHAGHHDTVEGGYVDVYPCDMDTYHEDIVEELVQGLIEDIK